MSYVAAAHTRLREAGLHSVFATYRDGLHGLPQPVVDAWEAFEKVDPHDKRHTTPEELLASERAAGELYRALSFQGAPILSEFVQPAFATRLGDFSADVTAAGRYAQNVQPDIPLLTEPDEVRQAYIKIQEFTHVYARMRATWAALRHHDLDTSDPGGLRSALTEASNLPEVLPDWFTLSMGGGPLQAGPWPGTAVHTRLVWLIQHGADLWLPTAVQQSEVWSKCSSTAVLDPRSLPTNSTTPSVSIPTPDRPARVP